MPSPEAIKSLLSSEAFKIMLGRTVQCVSASAEVCETYGCKLGHAASDDKWNVWKIEAKALAIEAEARGRAPSVKQMAARVKQLKLQEAQKATKMSKTCKLEMDEFMDLALGYTEGSKVNEKVAAVAEIVKNAPDNGVHFGDVKVIAEECGDGAWGKVCSDYSHQSWKCTYKSQEQCTADPNCDLGVYQKTGCDVGYHFLDKICPSEGAETAQNISPDKV
jgi:hypothetical protein